MKKNVPATAGKMMIIISMFVFVAAALPDHLAWGNRNFERPGDSDTCLFTRQLKENPEIKNRYEAMVIKASDQFASKVQSVEEMYSDISKTSIEEDEEGAFSPLSGKNTRVGISRDVDNLTALCLGCHDGASARDVSVDVRNDPYASRNRFTLASSDHPIGMDYNRYVSSGKSYKPATNPKMIFVNGKVGCLTCHDPFNPEKGHLVVSDRQGALCLTCHNK